MASNPVDDDTSPVGVHDPLPRLGLILLAAVTLGWGSSWAAMKTVLMEMSPWGFRTISILPAGLLLILIARASRISLLVPSGRWGALTVSSLLNITGWHMFSAFGLEYLPAGRAALVAYTMPLWASLLAVIVLGEALTRRLVTALALGMAGVWVLLSGDLTAIGAAPQGIAFMLAAALSWGAGVVYLKWVDWRMPTISVAAWQLVLGSIPVVVVSGIIGEWRPPPLSAVGLFALIYTILIPITFCTYAYTKVIRLFPAHISAIGTLLIPVIGVLGGAVLLGESLSWREAAAIGFIVSALTLILLVPARRSE